MASAVSLLLLPSPRPLRRAAPALQHSRLASQPRLPSLVVGAPRVRPLAPPPRASNPNNDNDNNSGGAVEAPDRLVAAVAYLYPFLDGVHHGRFLLAQFPLFATLLSPLAPAARLFRSSPFTPFLLFLTLYFAVVRNQQAFSRFVRFNAMQAVALDVLLIFPDLLAQSFAPTGGGIGFELFQSMESTVFLFLLVCLVYGGGACLLGKTPRLPIVADAAERQVM
uniref:Protein TIC 20 n=1 Tax=Leersia perrieri TaxID=77586 RepID=A0A0D9VKH9_9ORYZ